LFFLFSMKLQCMFSDVLPFFSVSLSSVSVSIPCLSFLFLPLCRSDFLIFRWFCWQLNLQCLPTFTYHETLLLSTFCLYAS
jgi:hypothetical protein